MGGSPVQGKTRLSAVGQQVPLWRNPSMGPGASDFLGCLGDLRVSLHWDS